MKRKEVQISGFGGQGIILAGYILGKAAAIYDGQEATFTQSYGPESRGGACSAQLVLADGPIHYPHLICPQVLVAMSQEACDRYLSFLGEDGVLIVDEDLVAPPEVPASVRVYRIPATRLAEEMGSVVSANIAMLGFLVGVTGVVSLAALRKAVETSVPKGTAEVNLRALDLGFAFAQRTVGAGVEASSSRGG
ncbi:MAG: 2-oxoacid:acceptor oxidoreductase family protein [Anaerolineae bacterium]